MTEAQVAKTVTNVCPPIIEGAGCVRKLSAIRCTVLVSGGVWQDLIHQDSAADIWKVCNLLPQLLSQTAESTKESMLVYACNDDARQQHKSM